MPREAGFGVGAPGRNDDANLAFVAALKERLVEEPELQDAYLCFGTDALPTGRTSKEGAMNSVV